MLENDTWVVRTYVSYFFISIEGVSILENVAELGVPIPPYIIDKLGQIKGCYEEKEKDDKGEIE